jgi:hypothetical protein
MVIFTGPGGRSLKVTSLSLTITFFSAKHSFGDRDIPKCNLGTRTGKAMLALTSGLRPLTSDFRLVLSDGFSEGDITGLEIQRRLFRSSKNAGSGVVELAFPAGDDDGGEAIADQVYAGTPISINSSTPKMTATPIGPRPAGR